MSSTVVLAFDKFRGSASATELTAAATRAAEKAGWSVQAVPLADGGEGSLEVLGGANRTTTVPGPLGQAVESQWRLEGDIAFIEMASASGLALIGGAEKNDPMEASTAGTGRLIAAAVELGARRVVVLLGGSATTDGGLGAVEAMPPAARLRGVELIAACDVETRFSDAAVVFGPQKGATPAQIKLLTRRLERLQQTYQERYGVDVSEVAGAGAAGGLAGGLVAVGGRIQSGFELLADHVRLDEALDGASLVITGEGFLDAGSFQGKVVGGVHRWAEELGVATTAIVGQSQAGLELPKGMDVRCLTDLFGIERSMNETLAVVETVVGDVLSAHS